MPMLNRARPANRRTSKLLGHFEGLHPYEIIFVFCFLPNFAIPSRRHFTKRYKSSPPSVVDKDKAQTPPLRLRKQVHRNLRNRLSTKPPQTTPAHFSNTVS